MLSNAIGLASTSINSHGKSGGGTGGRDENDLLGPRRPLPPGRRRPGRRADAECPFNVFQWD
jgi:hypothetical protein